MAKQSHQLNWGNMHKIKEIETDSIADELGLEAGDILLTINGQKVADVFDYRYMIQEEELTLELEKTNTGEIWELEIEKDETDDLGIIFESGLMDKPRDCRNKCIFCFVDQMPKGMRKSLYFKDDDPRLSFLSGNYVSLTNLDHYEAGRIARYHLSPLHISVHAAEPALRRKMLGNSKSDELFEHLHRFKEAGITMHFQIVLCKGVNDGAALDDTIGALLPLGDSLSVVPVGLTKFREGLYPLSPFTQEDAIKVIAQVEKISVGFAYCSDEWYIKAGLPMPPYEYYRDFPQLENGVGMWALFEREFAGKEDSKTGIVTGEAAFTLMQKLMPNTKVFAVRNDFFGSNITVSGLLTAKDIIKQIPDQLVTETNRLLLPGNMFRVGTEYTLDNVSRMEIEQKLGVAVQIGDVI